jgi:hypothetical protein
MFKRLKEKQETQNEKKLVCDSHTDPGYDVDGM